MGKIIGIYQFSFRSNGMVYVGQSIDLGKRRTEHLKLLRQNKHPNLRVQSCFNKHGKSDLTFEVLQILSDDEYSAEYLTELERVCYDALDPKARLNVLRPGNPYIAGPTGRAATSARSKAYWADPSARSWRAEETRRYFEDPVNRSAVGERNRTYNEAHPERNKRHSEIMKAIQSTPAARGANSARADRRHADPEYRDAHKASHNTPEYLTAAAVRSKARFEDPEYRAKMAEAISKYRYSLDDVTFSVVSELAVIVGVPPAQIAKAAGRRGRCRGHVIYRLPKAEIDPATGKRLTSSTAVISS